MAGGRRWLQLLQRLWLCWCLLQLLQLRVPCLGKHMRAVLQGRVLRVMKRDSGGGAS